MRHAPPSPFQAPAVEVPRVRRRAWLAAAVVASAFADACASRGDAVAAPASALGSAAARAPASAPGELNGVPLARRIDSYLDFLASDDLGGRETGTVHSLVTGQFVASVFRSAGLQPAGEGGDFLQSYPLASIHLALDETTAALQPPGAAPPVPWRLFDDFLVRGYTSQGFELSGELVFAGYGIESEKSGIDEYAGLSVKGRLAVVLDGRPKDRDDLRSSSHWRAKRSAAKDRGAAGLVILSDPDSPSSREALDNLTDELRHPVMSIPAEEGGEAWPTVVVQPAAAAALMAAGGLDLAQERAARATLPQPGRELGGLRLLLHAPVVSERTHAYNIAGVVRGSDPVLRDEYVIVSAHNDHLGILSDGRVNNGADDNGSGTTTLLAAAEVLARGAPMKRSVLFLSVSGEEKGLLGSDWWCEHPTVPLDRCVADINIDMVGRNDPDAVGATPSPAHADYNSLVTRAVELGPQAGLAVTWSAPAAGDDLVDNYYHRSDHVNFAQKGIPVVFFFSGLHADYHRPTDTREKIDRDKLARMVRLVSLLAADTANAAFRPSRIKSGDG